MDLVHLQSKLTHLLSNFFSRQFFFCIFEKGILVGKKLLCKRVSLLCKESYSRKNYRLTPTPNHQYYIESPFIIKPFRNICHLINVKDTCRPSSKKPQNPANNDDISDNKNGDVKTTRTTK
jgi:hypothetical protein